MHKRTIAITFFIALALGVLGTLYLPEYLRPYLPESLVGKVPVAKGTVLAKEKKGNSLLLTVSTP